jgi:mono/diheme cytochrome c family protein
MKKYLVFIFTLVALSGCYYDVETVLYAPNCDNTIFSYNGRIKSIMETNCTGCHSGSNPSAGIPLTNFTETKTADNAGVWLCSIEQLNQCSAMPKGGKLSDCEIEACRKWVEAGYPEN